MRHSLLQLAIILSIFVFSCENNKSLNDDTICNDSTIIIGDDYNFIVEKNSLDTLIYPQSASADSIEFFIDLDSNSINDFKLISYLQYSPMVYLKKTFIVSLNIHNKVIVNETGDFPEILNINDTIHYSDHFISGRFLFTSCFGSNEIGNNDPPIIDGTWSDIQDKYVGLLIDDNDNHFFGWVKVEIIDNYRIHLIEIAAIKGCVF